MEIDAELRFHLYGRTIHRIGFVLPLLHGIGCGLREKRPLRLR
jgi:hypothetical protein